MKKILITFILLFLFIPFVSAKENVTIYLFHSDSCPHCKNEREFLSTLEGVNIEEYEVSHYSKLLSKVRNNLNIRESSVPITIIGSDYLIGYSEDIKQNILNMIEKYENNEHCDVVNLIIENKDITKCIEKNEKIYKKDNNKTISFFGKTIKFNAKDVSLPLISIIIGFIDGFNPCAMWVLIFLISMLLNLKDRKKMWLLGLTFIITSALVYMLFMLGILKIANSLIGTYFKYLVALIALIGGIINLNNFRKSINKNVGCEVTNKEQKKKTINKIKNILSEKNLIISIVGIIMLAISVNLVELACSAGLPALFIEVLSLNNLNTSKYILFITLYIIMFMLDDVMIFIIAMTTLKVTGVSNKYTKYSHLIGGIIMVLIGLLMIFKTEWLMFNF